MKPYDIEKDLGIKPDSLLKKEPKKPVQRPPQKQRLIMIISSIAIAVILGLFILPSKYKDEIEKTKSPDTNVAQRSETQTTSEKPLGEERQNTVVNQQVIKSIKLIPTNPTIKDNIKADIEFVKPEYSNELKIKYEWLKNNTQIIEGVSGDTLPAGLVQKGNYVNVRIQALKDGQVLQTVVSNMIMIVNSPPALFMSVINDKVKTNEPIVIQLRAEDPEGDKITFSLEEAPEGMSIDQSTGKITYYVSKPSQGSIRFRASAIDSEGAKVSGTYEISFTVQPEKTK